MVIETRGKYLDLTVIVVVVVVTTLAFDFTTGFHDTADRRDRGLRPSADHRPPLTVQDSTRIWNG